MSAVTPARRSRARRASRLVIALVTLAALVAVSWMVLTIGNPFPPSVVVMATGPGGEPRPAE
jgi:ABC-type transporter Mla subunit MlaD